MAADISQELEERLRQRAHQALPEQARFEHVNTRFATPFSFRCALPIADSRDLRARRMKTAIALLGLLTAPILWAAEVPGIAPGDYLLVYAQIIECGSDPQAIEAAQVNDDGVLTLFGDASLVAAGKSVRQVRDELLDEMERRTGHRAKTLDLVYVPGNDKEAAAKRLVRFSAEVERSCSRRVLPPSDIDENRVEAFGKLVSSDRGSARQPIATTRVGAIIPEAA